MEELVDELKQAVKFYADRENYFKKECASTGITPIQDDEGMRAETALQLIEDLEELIGVQHG